MKTASFSILLSLLSLVATAQECNCPPGVGDDAQTLKTFHFSNGKEMGICGFNTIEGTDTSYTRFSLFLCGDSKPIETWGENITCKLERTKDALLVKEMYNLPVGQSFSTLWRPFYVHKYTFTNGKVTETEYFDKQLPRYNKEQIAAAIQQYKDLPPTANEQTMKVANMLFWAAVSGSKETESLLATIPDKFGPFDNVIGEEWKQINAVYTRWKTKGK